MKMILQSHLDQWDTRMALKSGVNRLKTMAAQEEATGNTGHNTGHNTHEDDKRDEEQLEGLELLTDMFDDSNGQSVPKANVADMFGDDLLKKVGRSAKEGYDSDIDSMIEWSELVEFGLDLVKQETHSKSTPWDGAANFKSPELMKAALKFSDRASAELLRSYEILKIKVIGDDPENLKFERGERVSEFQNWQLNIEMPEWREEHEKMIYDIPYAGTVFKKTFFDAELGRNNSKLITYPNFSVSNDVDSLTRLRRFSELHDFSENEIIEKQRLGIWRDVDLQLGDRVEESDSESESDNFTSFIEQDGWYDLDNDGYEEPYTFVFQESTGVIVRIMPRFELKDVQVKGDEIVRIKAEENVTKYGFIRDPQGGFLDVGYTHLLSAIVSGINTTTNQLVDAASLANLQGGHLAKGFRQKMGDSTFKPGEWKQTGIPARDLQSGIMPLQFKEPSATLLALMQFMVTNTQELAASADLKGALGASAPVGTTLAMIDEQMQGTGAIVKRIYRSMSSEFRKLFELNAKFVDPAQYTEILDNPEANFEVDFNLRGMDIVPTANPEIATKTQRIIMANAEVQIADKLAMVGGNAAPLYRSFLETIGSTVVDEVFPEGTPEQQLTDLLTQNPQLEALITDEQSRLDLITQAQVEAVARQEAREDAELAGTLDEKNSKTALNEANVLLTLEKAETEDVKNQISKYTAPGQIDAQQLQNEQALQQLQQPQELNNDGNI